MTALDESSRVAAEGVKLEKTGLWLMAAYWLAMLVILGLGAVAGA